MTRDEVAKILTAIAAIDNRTITEATVAMWGEVLSEVRPNEKPYTYDEAWSAVPKWFAQNDGFMSPRALIAQMKKAREDLALEKHNAEIHDDEGEGEPQPICKTHNLNILDCYDCCQVLSAEVGYMHGDRLHNWAIANLYRADSIIS